MDKLKALRLFLDNFVAKNNRFRDSDRNGIIYIHETLNLFFRKILEIENPFTIEELINTLMMCGYKMRKYENQLIGKGDEYLIKAHYFGIKIEDVKNLRVLAYGIPKSTNDENRNNLNLLMDQIQEFKNEHKI